MSPALQRPHVLIVSDDPELAAFLGEGLVYAGFWTSAIASAVQALEVFRLRSFDVMVLDAALGGIGALELLMRLRGRSDRATSAERTDIPILVIAASQRRARPRVGRTCRGRRRHRGANRARAARGRSRARGHDLASSAPGPRVGRRSRFWSCLDTKQSCENDRIVAPCQCTDTVRDSPVTGTSAQYRSSLCIAGPRRRHRYVPSASAE